MAKRHPFPMIIEAHAGSNVIVGCSGTTSVQQGAGPADELETELLRSFRSLSIRDRVDILHAIYEKQKKK